MTARVGSALPDLDHADSLGVLHRQAHVLELVAAGIALPDVLGAVTEALEELIAGSRCSVLLLDAPTGTLHHGAAPTLPPEYSAAIDGLPIGDDAGSCGAAAFHDARIVASDIAQDRRWDQFRALAMPHGMRSCWSSPIRGGTGVLGTFAVYHDEPHSPSEREHRLVDRFTHLASVAIEHSRLYGALAESEERFRRAFEDNAVGMALTAPDGKIGKVNRALQDMLGRSAEQLLASDIVTLLHPDAGADAPAALDRLAHGADSVQFETLLTGPDPAPVRAACTASVVRGADGAPRYLSVAVLDVTARRAAERERRARREAELARAAAEEASRAKSQFLSELSHEMRTPLQAITGFAELLGTLDLPGERRAAALGHISGAASHILSLVDDVLDVARIEAGALPLQVADVPVGPLVTDVVALIGPEAAERGVTVTARATTEVVRADERRLRQVLINLVANGVRYNNVDGGVWVEVAGAGDEVVLDVCDSGQGIAPELIDRLFVPFDRLGSRDGSGSGLGMVLARGLTEAMGGALTVHATSAAGTTMRVVLPAGGGQHA